MEELAERDEMVWKKHRKSGRCQFVTLKSGVDNFTKRKCIEKSPT
jgi:hypothetical protein